MQNLKNTKIIDKKILLPVYFPDATRAVVRGLDFDDLLKSKVQGLVINTYHLMTQPGNSVIKAVGGIKKYMSWDGLIITDSGGFQLLSLIYRDSSFGKVDTDGVVFYKSSKGKKKKYKFTPEKSIQTQFNLNADIMICLDDCPSTKADREQHKISVGRTIEWAKRCKEEFLRQIEIRKMNDTNRPILFAVVQGGGYKDLRESCAEILTRIGFDGYGFGGWPLNNEGVLDKEILSYTASLTPNNLPKFALGVGNPQAIVEAFKAGYNMFDCVLPTRDARHKRLYNLTVDPFNANFLEVQTVYKHLHIADEQYVRDTKPLSDFCDCFTCQHFSRSYLHHLFDIEDSLAGRLATIHNLRTYTLLIDNLRKYAN
jgi:queuine tRNA-ribosyltransferase